MFAVTWLRGDYNYTTEVLTPDGLRMAMSWRLPPLTPPERVSEARAMAMGLVWYELMKRVDRLANERGH
jgi:hypothetical protein